MKFFYPMAFLAATSFLIQSTVCQAGLPPITSATSFGSGCRSFKAVNLGGDSIMLSFTDGDLTADFGPGIPMSASRSSCVVELRFGQSQAFNLTPLSTYLIGTVDIYGDPTLELKIRDLAFKGGRVSASGAHGWNSDSNLSVGPWRSAAQIPLVGKISSGCATSAELKANLQLSMIAEAPESNGGSAHVEHVIMYFKNEPCSL
ncbi:MAG TPA: DUF4360 domain-containing protein [Oligoflexus sp.]|uniref:DUF4360 domain-containing protein n=1 Tax=Oligoflexus sp. TaxID=1971216 RepID=UPI002D531BE5|nr:DUF4360 domain-containing protein [Oligoflexus sp.]HYX34983.1 DUF4360 domain-containing protein [Oligoflexus sp.]